MPLQFNGSYILPYLKIGFIIPFNQLSGTIPLLKQYVYILNTGSMTQYAIALISVLLFPIHVYPSISKPWFFLRNVSLIQRMSQLMFLITLHLNWNA